MYFFKMLFTLKITFFFSDDPNPTMYIPQKVESSAESAETSTVLHGMSTDAPECRAKE